MAISSAGRGRLSHAALLSVAAGALVGAGTVGAALFGNFSQDAAAVLATAVLAALLLSAGATRYGQTRDVFDPLVLFCGVLLFYFAVHALWLLQPLHDQGYGILRPFRSSLPHSQALMIAGVLALIVGFAAVPRTMWSTRRRDAQRVTELPLTVLAILFLGGILLNVQALRAGGYSRSAANAFNVSGNVLVWKSLGYISTVSFFMTVIAMYRADAARARRARRLVLAFMLPSEVAWSLAAGSKLELVGVLFGWLAIRNYTHARMRASHIVIGIILFVFVFTPFVDAQRTASINTHVSGLAAGTLNLSQFASAGSMLLREPWRLINGLDLIQRRTNAPESLALAVAYTPTIRPYQHGASWQSIVVAPIPRFIWRNKPVFSVTRDFSFYYANEPTGAGYGMAVSPTIPGDLYMNFGLYGLTIGLGVVGAFLKLVSNLSREPVRMSEHGLVLYVVLLVPLLLVEQDVATIGVTIVAHVVAVLIFFSLASFWSTGQNDRRLVTKEPI